MCDSTLFHIRRKPNISLTNSPQQVADDIQGLRLDLSAEVWYSIKAVRKEAQPNTVWRDG